MFVIALIASVQVYPYTSPLAERSKWPFLITTLTTPGPYIWFGDLQVLKGVQCFMWHWMALLRPGVIEKQSVQLNCARRHDWSNVLSSWLVLVCFSSLVSCHVVFSVQRTECKPHYTVFSVCFQKWPRDILQNRYWRSHGTWSISCKISSKTNKKVVCEQTKNRAFPGVLWEQNSSSQPNTEIAKGKYFTGTIEQNWWKENDTL